MDEKNMENKLFNDEEENQPKVPTSTKSRPEISMFAKT